MQRLVAEGLLHAIRNRGVFVTVLSLADVRDIFHTRAVIERAALEQVLPEAAQATAEALQPSVAAMRTAARHEIGRASCRERVKMLEQGDTETEQKQNKQ